MPDPKSKKISKVKAMAKPVMMERTKTKVPSKVNVKAPTKEEVESKIGRIKTLEKEAEDIRQGEAEFGKDYRDLGLKLQSKGFKRVGDDVERDEKGNVKFKRFFVGSQNDEDGSSESVTKEGDLLKVVRKEPKFPGRPDIGMTQRAFYEKPSERKQRIYEEGKSRALGMMKKAQNQKPQEPTRYMSDENVAKIAEALKKQK